jgi:hypothetical protein
VRWLTSIAGGQSSNYPARVAWHAKANDSPNPPNHFLAAVPETTQRRRFTDSGETLNKGGIPVFLLLCLKKEEARCREA